jgi:tetratricopeptide (TPR) repeat protein
MFTMDELRIQPETLEEAFRFALPDDEWLREIRDAIYLSPLSTIGEFDLLEEVGRGGQGVIYRAQHRASGASVAIKRLRAESLASPAARQRFERELEAAGSLDHPAIVSVLEKGHSDDVTHFAMPWIDGVPITQWADPAGASRRSPVEIAALMRDVCRAVHHAHQHGLIHRDLKPSNILVDALGRPHILDFGLAKRTESGENAASDIELTMTGDFVGTPAYAAPEQLRGETRRVDVRSDVYALGLILYEMIAGRLPHDRSGRASGMGLTAPDRPSRHNPLARGDLDAIALKAIAEEPERRYQSVDAFASDLDRFLHHQPVLARPPHAFYLARKSIRRHPVRWGIALTAIFFVIGGGVAAMFAAAYLAEARAQEHDAREDERKARLVAEQMNEFLTAIFTSADPIRASGAELTARQALDAASARLGSEFASAPVVKANLHNALAASYLSLGVYDQAEAHLLEADRLLNTVPDAGALAGDVAGNLAALRYEQGLFDEAERFARRSLEIHRRIVGDEHPDTAQAKNNLGAILRALGRADEARPLYEEALRTRRALLGSDHPDVAETLNNLAGLIMLNGDPASAQPLFEQALAARRKSLGEEHVLTAQSMDNLATVLARQGRYDQALPYSKAALEILRDALDARHPFIGSTASSLGGILVMLGRADEAEPLLREALSIRVAAFGPGDRRVALTRVNYGDCLRQLGRLDEAENEFTEALRPLDERDPTQRGLIVAALDGLIAIRDAQGRTDDSAELRARQQKIDRADADR